MSYCVYIYIERERLLYIINSLFIPNHKVLFSTALQTTNLCFAQNSLLHIWLYINNSLVVHIVKYLGGESEKTLNGMRYEYRNVFNRLIQHLSKPEPGIPHPQKKVVPLYIYIYIYKGFSIIYIYICIYIYIYI